MPGPDVAHACIKQIIMTRELELVFSTILSKALCLSNSDAGEVLVTGPREVGEKR